MSQIITALFLVFTIGATHIAHAKGFDRAKVLKRISDPAAMNLGEKLLGKTVETIIRGRCQKYARDREEDLKQCKLLARDLMIQLNIRSIPQDRANKDIPSWAMPTATFAEKSMTLPLEPPVQHFLEDILDRCHDRNHDHDNSSLWTWAVEHSGSEDAALEWLAMLFQDTNRTLTNVYGLMSLYRDKEHKQSISRLREVINCLNTKDTFSYYPPFAKVRRSRAAYHFYVIAYGARKLAANHPSMERMAAVVPFLFNTTYEYYRHRLIPGLDRVPNPKDPSEMKKLRWLDIPRSVPAVLWAKDPAAIVDSAIPTNPSEYTDGHVEYTEVLDDLYSGYAGAYYGAMGLEMNYDEFISQFPRGPEKFIRAEMVKQY